MDSISDTLYAAPSFVEGAARVLDLGNTMAVYNSSPTPEEADSVSIGMDWTAVGYDIRTAHKSGDPANVSSAKPEEPPSCR